MKSSTVIYKPYFVNVLFRTSTDWFLLDILWHSLVHELLLKYGNISYSWKIAHRHILVHDRLLDHLGIHHLRVLHLWDRLSKPVHIHMVHIHVHTHMVHWFIHYLLVKYWHLLHHVRLPHHWLYHSSWKIVTEHVLEHVHHHRQLILIIRPFLTSDLVLFPLQDLFWQPKIDYHFPIYK